MRRQIVGLLVLLLLTVMLVDSADAQRRRRRRRPAPQPTEQTEPPAPDAGQEEPPANPYSGGEGEEAAGGDAEAQPPAEAPAEGDAEPAAETGPEAPAEGAAEGEAEGGYDDYAPLGPDLGPLRSEFTSIMDELVQVRSRMAVIGRQLFHTKVQVRVHNRAGGDNTLSRLVVSLDGAPVHRGDGSDLGEDVQSIFEGFAAPGPHVLTLEVEQRQRADDDYRYTIRDSFRFVVEREKLTEITVVLDDDSDMGEDFEDDGEAEYDLSTRVRVATRDLER